jgi:sortase A
MSNVVEAAEISYAITSTITPFVSSIPLPRDIPISENVNSDLELPQNLLIPKISLVAPIVESGKTESGNMYVPPDDKTIGWWKFGVKPGEIGSAVLAGHFRVNSGAPGVFYNLDQITVGDEIDIIKTGGEVLKFSVIRREVYPVDLFPLTDFFNSNDAKKLNLITCSGKYLRDKKDYSHRLAIYAVLID